MEAAASIIGLVAIGLKVYVTLEGFVSTCKDAPEIAKVTRDEVRDFWYALHRLRPYIERTANITPLGAAATDSTQLSLTLGSCMVTFSEVEKLLDRLLPKSEMNYFGRIRWSISGAGLAQLIKRIQQHKTTLNLLLTIWMSESSAQTEQAIDSLNDLLKDLLNSKEQPSTPDPTTTPEVVPSLHDAASSAIVREPCMPLSHDGASILTTSTSLTAQSKHSLKSILLKTKPYRDPKLFESSGFSISTSRRHGTPWSQFSVGSNTSVFSLPFTNLQWSGLSIAEEGNLSRINVPIDHRLLYRPYWYPNLAPTPTTPSTSDPRKPRIRWSSKDSSRPISIPPRPDFEEDSFDLIRTSEMEEVSEVILSGRDPDGDFLCYVANKSTILAEMILDRACDHGSEPPVVHPLLGAAIRIRRWELIDVLFRRNLIPESGLIDSHWRQVTLNYAAENIPISQALCKGPLPASSLPLAVAADASDAWTPLAFACVKGNLNMIKFLLNNGADVREALPSGMTALHHATVPPINITIVKILIDSGADIKTLHQGNVPLLHYLITYYLGKTWGPDLLELFHFLLGAGCSLSQTDHNGTNVLSYATVLGDLILLEFLLNHTRAGLYLEAKDRIGETALHKALIYPANLYSGIPALLLGRGADANAATGDGSTPLMLCLEHNVKQSRANVAATPWRNSVLITSCIKSLEMMVAHGADINAKGQKGMTPLIRAIQCHDPELDPGLVRFHFLIESGASLSITDDNGDGALIHAVRKGDLDLLRLLWLNSVDMETVNNCGRTALHEALLGIQVDVVGLLLEQGANIEAKAADGSTPLLFFIRQHYYPHPADVPCHTDMEHGQILDVLWRGGADTTAITPLRESFSYDLLYSKPLLPLLKLLIGRGFDLANQTIVGSSVPIDAKQLYDALPDSEVLEFIIENWPALWVSSDHLNSALVYATIAGHRGPMQLLLEKGADPNARSGGGQTLLHISADSNDYVTARLLLEQSADMNALDEEGQTPLEHAIGVSGSSELIKLLVTRGARMSESTAKYLTRRYPDIALYGDSHGFSVLEV